MLWTEEHIYLVSRLGYEFAMQGRYQEATILFEGLIAAAPQYAYARCALAAIRLRSGDGAEALAAIDAGGLANRDLPSRRLRLESLLQLGWHKEAQEEYSALRSRLEPTEIRRFTLLIENKQLAGGTSDN